MSTRITRKQAALAQRSFTLRLYKALLRSHRLLPLPMRQLGDTYVRSEFKLHKNAQPQHLQPFFQQWLNYLAQIKQFTESGEFSEALKAEDFESLSGEQKEQLMKLRDETLKLGAEYVENEESFKEKS